jgi:ABC-2 type transport system ATP-binding protein
MTAAELRHVTRRYGRRVALDNVSLAVDSGEILGLVGPNGAGKTTLLRIFAGLVRPHRGAVWINRAGSDPIVYFGGERTLPPAMSDRRWMTMWTGSPGPATGRRLGVLSRGTRQRIGLEAMLAAPSIQLLLLDEPWEGLDPDASRWLSAALIARRAEGTAILVSSHRIYDLAAVCDRCGFLADGRIGPGVVACHPGVSIEERSALLLTEFDRVMAGTCGSHLGC